MKPTAKATVSPPWSITAFTASCLYRDTACGRYHNRDRCHNSSRRIRLNCNWLVNSRFFNFRVINHIFFRSLIDIHFIWHFDKWGKKWTKCLFIQYIFAVIFTKWFDFTSLTVKCCNGNCWSLRLIVGQINLFVIISNGPLMEKRISLKSDKRKTDHSILFVFLSDLFIYINFNA